MADKENGRKKGRWDADVPPYAEMGCWVPDYEPKDTDVLAAFRITPEPGGALSPRVERGLRR